MPARLPPISSTSAELGSPLRLVNLALAMSGLVTLAVTYGFLPRLIPRQWRLEHFFSKVNLAQVDVLAIAAAELGMQLWLPASVLMLIFWFTGLRRKLAAPRSNWITLILVLTWLLASALLTIPLAVTAGESAPAVMLVIGIALSPLFIAGILGGTTAAVLELSALVGHQSRSAAQAPLGLLLWASLPLLALAMPLLSSRHNPLATTVREQRAFQALCQGVGVQFLERPAAPVRSIAYAWNTAVMKGRPQFGRYELSDDGRIKTSGGFPQGAKESRKTVVFDFTENAPDHRSGRALVNPDMPFYHFPRNKQNYGVAALSADLLGYHDADKSGGRGAGAVRRTYTLTDRRSGKVLAVQTYVVDEDNQRACGANVGNTISLEAFVHDAINR